MSYSWEPPRNPDWQYMDEVATIGEWFNQQRLQSGMDADRILSEAAERFTRAHRDFLDRIPEEARKPE
jgi:hypothetical protein